MDFAFGPYFVEAADLAVQFVEFANSTEKNNLGSLAMILVAVALRRISYHCPIRAIMQDRLTPLFDCQVR